MTPAMKFNPMRASRRSSSVKTASRTTPPARCRIVVTANADITHRCTLVSDSEVPCERGGCGARRPGRAGAAVGVRAAWGRTPLERRPVREDLHAPGRVLRWQGFSETSRCKRVGSGHVTPKGAALVHTDQRRRQAVLDPFPGDCLLGGSRSGQGRDVLVQRRSPTELADGVGQGTSATLTTAPSVVPLEGKNRCASHYPRSPPEHSWRLSGRRPLGGTQRQRTPGREPTSAGVRRDRTRLLGEPPQLHHRPQHRCGAPPGRRLPRPSLEHERPRAAGVDRGRPHQRGGRLRRVDHRSDPQPSRQGRRPDQQQALRLRGDQLRR